MKKKILGIVMMLILSVVNAQDLPNIVPVSPEAGSLGKYGDMPVNLSTGRINYTIPIFTVREGGIELPIYLSYNHSGLLAEEDPGIAGLGWTLHAGGAIVRQLRGKPDESTNGGYLGSNVGKNYVIKSNLTSQERQILYRGSNSGNLDTEPDQFIINAGGVSGNFSYNADGNVIFYPQKNFKVFKANNDFKITDDSGVIYEFDQEEVTSSESVSESSSSFMEYVSSWGLTKVKIPYKNREISLQYSLGAPYQKIGYSESQLKAIGSLGSSNTCTSISQSINRATSITDIVSTRQISRINFSQGSVIFDIREVPSNSFSRNKNYLHGITIKDLENKTISSFQFVYDDLLSNFKLLKEIKKFGSEGNLEPFYKFEYKDTPPKQINYSSQDYLGYYNGTNNTYLLSGNRDYRFNYSILGALTKVIYPTKGFTEVIYESNEVPRGALNTCKLPKVNKSETINISTPSYDVPIQKSIFIKQSQKILVTLKTRADTGTSSNDLGEIIEAFASISGTGLSCALDEECGFLDCRKSIRTLMENGMQLDGGNKEVKAMFSVNANTTLTIEGKLEGSGAGLAFVSVAYFDPDLPDPTTTPETTTAPVGGIRVSLTRDCTKNGDCISKSYKYVSKEGGSSGRVLFTPVYKNTITHKGLGLDCRFVQKTAQSRIPLSSFQGAPVFYDRVEVSYNGNSDSGKEVNYYTSFYNPTVFFPFAPVNSKDWKKGNLIKKEIYKNVDNDLILTRLTENIYQSSYPFQNTQDNSSVGFVAKRNTYVYPYGDSAGHDDGAVPNDYGASYYDNRPEFYNLIETKTTDYYNGRHLESTIDYNYNSLTGYIDDQQTTNSKGELLKTTNSYPTTGVLITQNRISSPLRVESTKITGGLFTKLNAQNTVYKDFGSNLYLPEKIQSSKGEQAFEDRILYHQYDDLGNPLEVSKKDGTHIAYIWGYNKTQPIAKIENATYAQVSNYVNNLQTMSNLDKNEATENSLRTQLNNLRNVSALENSQITTYTYDPLVGVTSITDPRGETLFYEYDDLSRLKLVKNADGHILKEHKYNYKN